MPDPKEKFFRAVKRTICKLKGCQYADGDLQTKHIPEHQVTCFIQKCVRCGEYRVFAVNDSALHSYYPLETEFEFNG